jgi:hypothetical protein
VCCHQKSILEQTFRGAWDASVDTALVEVSAKVLERDCGTSGGGSDGARLVARRTSFFLGAGVSCIVSEMGKEGGMVDIDCSVLDETSKRQ